VVVGAYGLRRGVWPSSTLARGFRADGHWFKSRPRLRLMVISCALWQRRLKSCRCPANNHPLLWSAVLQLKLCLISMCSCVCLCNVQCVCVGCGCALRADRSAPGAVHVQRAQAPGLRGGLPMARTIYQLALTVQQPSSSLASSLLLPSPSLVSLLLLC